MVLAEHAAAGFDEVSVVRLGRLAHAVQYRGQPSFDGQGGRVLRSVRGDHDAVRPPKLVARLGEVAQSPGQRGEVHHERHQGRVLAPQSQLGLGERLLDHRARAREVAGLGPRSRLGLGGGEVQVRLGVGRPVRRVARARAGWGGRRWIAGRR
jgi:hypothetical protein